MTIKKEIETYWLRCPTCGGGTRANVRGTLERHYDTRGQRLGSMIRGEAKTRCLVRKVDPDTLRKAVADSLDRLRQRTVSQGAQVKNLEDQLAACREVLAQDAAELAAAEALVAKLGGAT